MPHMFLFLDTEFTDFVNTELISIALVSEDGKHEFYRENTSHNPNVRSGFVNQIVMPLLFNDERAMTHDEIADDLNAWLDSLPADEVSIVCDYNGDWHLMADLLHKGKRAVKLKAVMWTAAFADMMIERGFATSYAEEKLYPQTHQQFIDYFTNVDTRQHNSLVDAQAMRHVWNLNYEKAKK